MVISGLLCFLSISVALAMLPTKILLIIFFSLYLQALILLTAGIQTKDQGSFTPLREVSEPLRDKGVKIYVVGVGSDDDIDVNELIQIAGSQENVVTIDLFEELVALAEEVSKVACGRKIPLNM